MSWTKFLVLAMFLGCASQPKEVESPTPAVLPSSGHFVGVLELSGKDGPTFPIGLDIVGSPQPNVDPEAILVVYNSSRRVGVVTSLSLRQEKKAFEGLFFRSEDTLFNIGSLRKSASMVTGNLYHDQEIVGEIRVLRGTTWEQKAKVPAFHRDRLGLYRGRCGGETASLMMYPKMEFGSHLDRPFGEVPLVASFSGGQGKLGCDHGCGGIDYHRGSLDLFKGTVKLEGRQNSLSCKLQGAKLTCGACDLEASPFKVSSIKPRTPMPKVPDGAGKFLFGNFYGFVNLGGLDRFQPIRISLTEETYQDGSGVQGMVNLFYGPFDSKEFSVHKFSGQKITKGSPELIVNTEGDLMIQGRFSDSDDFLGHVYSRSHGWLGWVYASRVGVPDLDFSPHQQVASLSRYFLSPQLNLDLDVRSGRSERSRDWFPLHSSGKLRVEGGQIERKIRRTFFDPFTNDLVIRFANDSYLMAKMQGADILDVYWLDPSLKDALSTQGRLTLREGQKRPEVMSRAPLPIP